MHTLSDGDIFVLAGGLLAIVGLGVHIRYFVKERYGGSFGRYLLAFDFSIYGHLFGAFRVKHPFWFYAIWLGFAVALVGKLVAGVLADDVPR
jgi:hypothetical protein